MLKTNVEILKPYDATLQHTTYLSFPVAVRVRRALLCSSSALPGAAPCDAMYGPYGNAARESLSVSCVASCHVCDVTGDVQRDYCDVT